MASRDSAGDVVKRDRNPVVERYRLYEIDRLVKRTDVYVVVTGLLVSDTSL